MSEQSFTYNYYCNCKNGSGATDCCKKDCSIEALLKDLLGELREQTRLLELNNALLVELNRLESQEYNGGCCEKDDDDDFPWDDGEDCVEVVIDDEPNNE